MGGSLALWLSVRRPDLVAACVSVYGNQSIDFAGARARYQLHFAEQDPLISSDDIAFLEATMRLEHLDVEVVTHGDTTGGFADESGPTFDAQPTSVLWDQVVDFLHDRGSAPAGSQATG